MVAGFDCLNSRKNLLHANSRLPIVFIIQDRKADGATGKNIGRKNPCSKCDVRVEFFHNRAEARLRRKSADRWL